MDKLTQRVDTLTGQLQSFIEIQNERVSELEKTTKLLSRQIGALAESFGASLEDFAFDMVPAFLKEHWKMEIESVRKEDFLGKYSQLIELDLVVRGKVESKPVVVFVEVKSNLTALEVKKFYKTVREILEYNESEFESAETRILFFGRRVNQEAEELIKANNSLMIFINGKIL